MPRIKESNKPKSLADVTIRQLIKYLSFEDELQNIFKKLESCEEYDIRFYKLEYYDLFCKMISAISSIPYETLQLIKTPFNSNLDPIGEFKSVIDHFSDFIKKMEYRPEEPTMDGFYFRSTLEKKRFQRKVKYHLFEFGQNTVIQQHYLLNEWSAFFASAHEGMTKVDFKYLPRLIAVIAWPEQQIDRVLGKMTAIRKESYQQLNEEIDKKEKIFYDLPLDVAFQILHHFFFSSPKCEKIIQTYLKDKVGQKQKQKKDTIKSMQ